MRTIPQAMPISATDITAPAVPSLPDAIPSIELHETIIEPTRGWIGINWREMFQARELLYFLIWRDLKVRYKQTILGVAWVVLQPLPNMILFTIIFGNAAGLNSRLPGHEHQYS